MKKIHLVTMLILFAIILIACDAQEVVCTTELITISSTTTTESTTTTGTTTTIETTSMQEYYQDIPINNEDDADELITDLVSDDVFAHISASDTIDDVNALANIECLRKVDNTYYYSIHKTESSVYVYFLYEVIDNVWRVDFVCRYSEDMSFDDFRLLLESGATINDTKEVYPDLITYMSSSQGYIYASVYLFNGDIYILRYYWDDEIQDSVLRTIQIRWVRNDNPIFSILLDKDLPSNLIHD
ncbi:MAG: hypothetical protein K9L64_06860 [Candidatus Izimaplasma sp.]|nr:hypothetical protein [Candidatus Izimaplasma bacterium]